MSGDRFDIIVIGGGPAGGMAAWTAARAGLRTVLLEEHGEIGAPTHCSGKLSVHAFREFDLPLSLARTMLRAATLYAPDGGVAGVRRGEIDSYVVDRDLFDRWLVARAAEAGAEIRLGVRARRGSRDTGTVLVDAERRGGTLTMRAPVVIDAEGARTLLPASLGIAPRRALIHGLQYEMEGLRLEADDTPELYFGREWAPGFFAWIMPLGGGAGRVGLCIDPRLTDRPPVFFLERLIADHPVTSRRAHGARLVRKLVGRIPVLGGRAPSAAPGLLIAGDAAGQVKATSGGGIYFSLVAGRLAAAAGAAMVGGDLLAGRRYEQGWQRRFGRELLFTRAVRRMLNALPDPDLSRLIRAIGENPLLQRAIEEHGDTQYQSRLLRPVLGQALRSWREIRLAPAVLRALVRGLLDADRESPSPGGRVAAEKT
ncbi:MAG: NAD(P)/FAD-dependent oxidoreductase [Armatimonadetes bacterium]|nr:NAD(P)/FAD-dependent oxidoreductase [Armatimonadota bacterium]